MEGIGISGSIAKAFIKSRLTPLFIIASLLLGLLAVVITPREEEPQILVPMIDVMVAYPGASPQEVEARVTKPMEKLLWEIKGVEYIYSIVKPGFNLTIVRFYVGQSMEDSIVNLNNKLSANYDRIPPGVFPPLIKQRSIDDVPILDPDPLERQRPLSPVMNSGGSAPSSATKSRRTRMYRSSPSSAGRKDRSGSPSIRRGSRPTICPPFRLQAPCRRPTSFSLPGPSRPATGNISWKQASFLKNSEDVGNVVTGLFNGRPVYLRDVAAIADGPEEPANYVFMGLGRRRHKRGSKARRRDRKRRSPSRSPRKKAPMPVSSPGRPWPKWRP